MRTAFIMATSRCNNACGFCFNRNVLQASSEEFLSPDEFQKAARELGGLGFTSFLFTGGEPLLHPELEKLLSIADKSGRADLITNGTFLDEKKASDLSEKLSGTLIWSLNDLYNSLPEQEEFLRETKKKMAMLAGKFPGRLSTIFVFTGQTYQLIAPVFQMCREAGVGVILQPAHVTEACDGDGFPDLSLSPEAWDAAEKAMEPWARLYGTYRYMDYLKSLFRKGDCRPVRCHAAGGFCVVDTDRTIYPCFHRRDTPLGKAGEGSVAVLQKNLEKAVKSHGDAHCFGSHCVSLFVE